VSLGVVVRKKNIKREGVEGEVSPLRGKKREAGGGGGGGEKGVGARKRGKQNSLPPPLSSLLQAAELALCLPIRLPKSVLQSRAVKAREEKTRVTFFFLWGLFSHSFFCFNSELFPLLCTSPPSALRGT